jgi:hypothetical protein
MSGYQDCNNDLKKRNSNGCEIYVLSNPRHCSKCNNKCAKGFDICVFGKCAIFHKIPNAIKKTFGPPKPKSGIVLPPSQADFDRMLRDIGGDLGTIANELLPKGVKPLE